jgi:hypothetical protein
LSGQVSKRGWVTWPRRLAPANFCCSCSAQLGGSMPELGNTKDTLQQ